MRRISIYVLYGMTILTVVSAFDYYANLWDWRSFYDSWYARRADALNDEALVGSSFMAARKSHEELADFLESRRRTWGIDFWAVYRGTDVVESSLTDEELKIYRFDLAMSDRRVEISSDRRFAYAVEALDGGEKLVVGVRYDKKRFLQDNLIDRGAVIIRYCLGLFLVCLAVFAFFFRDFMKSIGELARRGRRSYKGIGARSREADMLVRGLATYDERASELKKEKELFIWQVLPSLRTELMSGRPPPYDFGCTLVRTDINNFSTIYNTHPVEEFAATINDFFTEVSHVVARYNGLVHEFVGDEVIFYFKDEDCGSSVLAALSAIRDLNGIASGFHQMTMRDRGYAFTVKSAFAHGRLRFGKFVNGYGIAGPSLIESVRIISQIHEKEENIIVFDSRHRAAVENSVECEFYASTKLKGFPDERHLYSYLRHQPIEKLLEAPEFAESLRYYRSDHDIGAMIEWARASRRRAGDPKRIARVIGLMRQVPVTRSQGEPAKRLKSWIEELLAEVKNVNGQAADEQLRTLASILRLTENLVPPAEFTREYEDLLRSALLIEDRRVVANALDALMVFRRDYEPSLLDRLARHLDNRIAANALIHEGIRDINRFVIKRLVKLMSSKNPANVASALYAFGEIAAYHRIQDPVYFNTQIAFQRLAENIPALVSHGDARVRRQAFSAARKLGDAKLIAMVWQAVGASASLADEAREHLGEPLETKRSEAA